MVPPPEGVPTLVAPWTLQKGSPPWCPLLKGCPPWWHPGPHPWIQGVATLTTVVPPPPAGWPPSCHNPPEGVPTLVPPPEGATFVPQECPPWAPLQGFDRRLPRRPVSNRNNHHLVPEDCGTARRTAKMRKNAFCQVGPEKYKLDKQHVFSSRDTRFEEKRTFERCVNVVYTRYFGVA